DPITKYWNGDYIHLYRFTLCSALRAVAQQQAGGFLGAVECLFGYVQADLGLPIRAGPRHSVEVDVVAVPVFCNRIATLPAIRQFAVVFRECHGATSVAASIAAAASASMMAGQLSRLTACPWIALRADSIAQYCGSYSRPHSRSSSALS